MQKRNTALRKEIMCTRRCWGTENRRWIIGISERNAYLGGHQSAYKDKHCVPTGRRTPHPHGFLQTWRPYRTLGLRLSIRFTPNVVSTKSTIKNQQSKIPLYNAPNCFKYFSEFSLTFCGGFIESAFLKFLTAFFSSPFIA